MKMTKLFIPVSIFICLMIYGYSAIRIDTESPFGINIDLGKPFSVQWPCDIAIIGDNGEKGLRIPPKVGRGWRGEVGGSADYKFFVPEDGKYHIWAYSLWFDECANAVFAQVDNMDKAIIGNDPIYNEWHWVRGFDLKLKKGTHDLILSNHSDHIAIQEIFITNSSSQTPGGTGLVFSDIFYDGFDGCDQGNFTRWEITKGSWSVLDPQAQACFVENALLGKSEDEAIIIYAGDDWGDYYLDLQVRSELAKAAYSDVEICFNYADSENCNKFKIMPTETADEVRMLLVEKVDGEETELADFTLPWQPQSWHHLRIGSSAGKIEAQLDECPPVAVTCREKEGGIAFILNGKIEAYFDDIHVRQISGQDDMFD